MKVLALLFGTVASAALSQATPAAQMAAPKPVAITSPATGGKALSVGAEVKPRTAEYLATEHKELRKGRHLASTLTCPSPSQRVDPLSPKAKRTKPAQSVSSEAVCGTQQQSDRSCPNGACR